MRFVAPANHASEIAALVLAGVCEVYCGIAEPAWTARYGDHDSISRRQGSANLASREDLQALVSEATRRSLPVYLTLNGRYTEPQIPYLLDLCDAFAEMGGAGLQISDLGLMRRLRDRHTPLSLCLSLLAVAANAPTIDLYHDRFGISRIVLPRFLGPEECAELCAHVPHIEFEVMVAGDRCPFVDGYCRFYHGNVYGDLSSELCEDAHTENWRTRERYDTTYATHSCRMLLGDPPNEYPCAACELPAFERAGVSLGKIGGRGTPLAYRLALIDFLAHAQTLDSDEERRSLYERTFSSACNCYRAKSGLA